MMAQIVNVHGRQTIMSNGDDNGMGKNFRFLDVLMIISIALVGWNLKETIAIKNQQGVNTYRIETLEIEREKGERFTTLHGEFLKNDLKYTRQIFNDHITRTEPLLAALYKFILRNEAKE